jgi:hypothetical protein
MLLFASVVAPLLVTRTRVQGTCFAVCNEDGSRATQQFIDYVANSKSLRGLVYVFNVDTLEKGLALVASGEVSGMIHIPAGFYEEMRAGRDVSVDLYGGRMYHLECSLVVIAVETALNMVGRGQNALDVVRVFAVEQGVGEEAADAFYDDMLDLGIEVVTNRRAMLGEEGFVSLAGDYLPAEYYLAAMLALFLALATLPLSGFSAGDFSMSVLQRGMRTGSMRLRFLTARLLSGAIFLLTVTLLIFPVGLAAASLDRMFDGNSVALFVAMGVMALSFSAMSLGLSAWVPGRDAAVWAGFWLIMIFATTGGAILPEGMLPEWVKNLGLWSPVRAAMRLLAGTVFDFHADQFAVDLMKMGVWGAVGGILAAAGFMRRAAA